MDTAQFKEWKNSSEIGSLWLKAVPGAGKSVMAAHLASHIRNTEDTPVLRFFSRQIITTNRSHTSLWRDWLAQMLDYSPALQRKILAILDQKRSVGSLTSVELEQFLRSAFHGISRIFCIADALDGMNSD